MNTILRDFYEQQHKGEDLQKELKKIPYTKNPINRSQACVKYLFDNNISGDFLELGAGDGVLAYSLLNSNLDIKKYLATDFIQYRLENFKTKMNNDLLEIKQIDVDNFNADEFGKYDVVIMLALIEHLINPIKAMQEVRKLLKPNGIVFIETPNIADLGHRFKLLRGKFPSTASKNEGLTTYDGKNVENYDQGHLHYFTYRSISEMLQNYCGFSKVDKYYAPTGKLFFGKKIHNILAKLKPQMFSSVFVVAHF